MGRVHDGHAHEAHPAHGRPNGAGGRRGELEGERQEEQHGSPWGEVTSVITFSAWTLEPATFGYPRQVTAASNGRPDYMYYFDRLAVNGLPDTMVRAVPDGVCRLIADTWQRRTGAPVGVVPDHSPASD